jgi:hypothetical protein
VNSLPPQRTLLYKLWVNDSELSCAARGTRVHNLLFLANKSLKFDSIILNIFLLSSLLCSLFLNWIVDWDVCLLQNKHHTGCWCWSVNAGRHNQPDPIVHWHNKASSHSMTWKQALNWIYRVYPWIYHGYPLSIFMVYPRIYMEYH